MTPDDRFIQTAAQLEWHGLRNVAFALRNRYSSATAKAAAAQAAEIAREAEYVLAVHTGKRFPEGDNGKLREAARRVVEYDWQSEVRDYQENAAGEEDNLRSSLGIGPAGHIFEDLVALDNAVYGTDRKPADYIEED